MTLLRLLPLALIAFLANAFANESRCTDPRPLRLALIPKSNSELQANQYRPLIDLLAKSLGRPIELIAAPSYGTVIEGLLANHIDLAELGPASYAIAMSRGAQIAAFATVALRQGPHTDSGTAYRSLLLVRRDSGLRTLAQLRGKNLSLTDPASTSGAVLPRQAITQLTGYLPESYFGRVIFAGSHDRAIDSLRNRKVDAAFVASTRLDEAIRRGKVGNDEFAVLWRSELIPYDPFVMRQQLCAPLQKRIREVFLKESGQLKSMFQELDINGFVSTDNEQYTEIRNLFTTLP
ncbi:MAG: phosphate/phosphite/phosphonate ABC transporter substrate-binding protein [Rhodocyclales bacterium GT-UBC]|nr:MAG: phosphate/phosphite/phosphonate ABC transporter substrate-binding protein [Rhodocyclales bacterium GT-UBC]